jgi:hypothetical protein
MGAGLLAKRRRADRRPAGSCKDDAAPGESLAAEREEARAQPPSGFGLPPPSSGFGASGFGASPPDAGAGAGSPSGFAGSSGTISPCLPSSGLASSGFASSGLAGGVSSSSSGGFVR